MITYMSQKKAQSTVEYAVLIIIIIAALLSVQTYIKRGIQGRLKSASDDVGDQFSPGNTNVVAATRTHSKETQTFGVDKQGAQKSTLIEPELTNTVEKSAIINVDQEFYGQ